MPEQLPMQTSELVEQGHLEQSIINARVRLAKILAAGVILSFGATVHSAALFDNSLVHLPAVVDRYRVMPRYFARMANVLAMRLAMGIKMEHHGEMPQVSPEERVVFVVNHPHENAIFPLVDFLTTNFTKAISATSKIENFEHPRLGPLMFKPADRIGCVIPLDRGTPGAAIKSMRDSCKNVLTPGSGFMMPCDEHRPTEKSIAKSIEKYGPIPGVENQLTCYPKRGGLYTTKEVMRDEPVRFISVTNGFNRPKAEDARNLVKSTFNTHARDVTSTIINLSEEELGEWVLEEWRYKNLMLNEWEQEALPG